MKKLLFITLLFCGLAFSAQSQSLTYSKVILLTALDTVPQGKVWKVVSYQANSGANQTIYMKVNSNLEIIFSMHYSNGSQSTRNAPLPMWFPAGTSIEPWNFCDALNIIEFTENNE